MWLSRKTESRRKLALAAKEFRVAARGRVGVGEHQKVGVGVVRELSDYDSVLECAVCGECAQDLASGGTPTPRDQIK